MEPHSKSPVSELDWHAGAAGAERAALRRRAMWTSMDRFLYLSSSGRDIVEETVAEMVDV